VYRIQSLKQIKLSKTVFSRRLVFKSTQCKSGRIYSMPCRYSVRRAKMAAKGLQCHPSQCFLYQRSWEGLVPG